MSAMLTAFFWLLILALFQIGDGFAATKSVSDNDIMGDRAVMRAVMADYLRLQQEIRDWARYEGVDVSFGPIKIDIGGRTRSGEPALGAPGARAAGASCTVTLSASVAGQSVTVSATASTCAEAYEEAKQALKKALEDLRDLVRQITG
ncbi:MAG: hypothetical protein D6790_01915 [Caldilineae bacterium]|nr:MAG: hypothetical protein D6790_01915 [Caldilineae bacterium]